MKRNRSCVHHVAAAVGMLLLLCCGLTLAQTPSPAQAPVVAPSGPILDSGDGFAFDVKAKKLQKIRQSASGIACTVNASQQRVCLVAFDEGTQAGFATVKEGSLVPDPQAFNFKGLQGELDAEGAATDGQYVYITGSHSAKRADCASNPDSRFVLRLRLDPATGRAVPASQVQTGRLWSLMQAQPELAAYVGERKCLGTEPSPKAPGLSGQQGINIEGLAMRDGRLMFGFRGPVINGAAFIFTVDVKALFEGGDARPQVTRLALGPHRGIRDMVAVSDGVLILAGPDDDGDSEAVGWAIFHWDGKTRPGLVQPQLLARLDLGAVKLRRCDAEIKPEALTVLQETSGRYQLLMLSDGLCDGGPLALTLLK
ncbi:DUF3616 domain-containing protein [Rhodoferax sp. BLA1]|uniref:DUF3616 domain-containing protein n=1 Tax=Rhodoferax sp. BLA1 TaxID=2576062 RepID=UPI0015D2B135|nr:DUF3616 domain-containing protein [Rhodoferax sp. BLA1]